jgi:hypothetical protein
LRCLVLLQHLLHQSRHLFPASLVPSSASLFALSLSLSLARTQAHKSLRNAERERRALFFFSSQSLSSFWQCK